MFANLYVASALIELAVLLDLGHPPPAAPKRSGCTPQTTSLMIPLAGEVFFPTTPCREDVHLVGGVDLVTNNDEDPR
jgi:hypothetical protein